MHVWGQRTCCQFCPGQQNLGNKTKTKSVQDLCNLIFILPLTSDRWLLLTLTNNKDLCGLVSGRLRLCGLHFLEKLLKNPEQRLIVFGAEDLGDERPAFVQKVAGQFQSHEGQMGWKVREEQGHIIKLAVAL